MRGEKEVQALFKPRRGRKRKASDAIGAAAVVGGADAEAEESEGALVEEEEDDVWHQLSESESELVAQPVVGEEGGDVWHRLSESESELEDPEPVPATSSKKSPTFRRARDFRPRSAGPEVVVEDSDGDEVEIIA